MVHRKWLACALVLALSGAAAAYGGPDDEATPLLTQAAAAYAKHQFDDSIRLYRRANELRGGKCSECLWGLAASYKDARAYKKALETCDVLITLDPAPAAPVVAQAWNLRGMTIVTQAKAEKNLKRLPEAEAAFRKALEVNPLLHVAHYNLGLSLLSRSEDASGLAALRTYLERDPQGREAKAARRLIDNPRRARENFAPDFAFATLDGGYVSLDELRGKVVLVDFWGSWCKPCVDSIGSLRRINRRYEKEPFVLISISVGDPEDKWRQFVAAHQMTWPQYLDAKTEVSRAFGVSAFPSYVVLDHEGIVQYATYGSRTFTEAKIQFAIEDALKKLKKAPGSTARTEH